MLKIRFIVLVLSLLFALFYVQVFDVPPVEASTIYQGDLILTGNNVTTIEGRFDINGSIILEDNATLILQNAVLNFTQSQSYQHNITIGPSGANPQLLISNSTLAPSSGYLRAHAHDSYITIDNSTFYNINLGISHYSVLSVSNGSYNNDFVSTSDNTDATISDSSFKNLNIGDSCDALVSNSEIDALGSFFELVNCTISGLEPGFVNYWTPITNHTLNFAPLGRVSNVTLLNTTVDDWDFTFSKHCNVTLNNSTLGDITASYTSSVSLESINCDYMHAFQSSAFFINDSSLLSVRLASSSNAWLLNSTYFAINMYSDVTTKAFVSWYLNLLTEDSVGQPVPSASVTVSYPNATVFDSKLTDAYGLARFPLMEKLVDSTGEYPIGNYTVETTYGAYMGSTTVNMTETKQVSLSLENFVIPEFSSLVLLSSFVIATIAVIVVNRRKQQH